MDRESMIQEVDKVLKNIPKITNEKELKHVMRSIKYLRTEQQYLIYCKYIKKMSYNQISYGTGYSSRTMARKLNESKLFLAIIVFGVDAVQKNEAIRNVE